MKEDKLSDLSMQLSVDILKPAKELKAKHETVISNRRPFGQHREPLRVRPAKNKMVYVRKSAVVFRV